MGSVNLSSIDINESSFETKNDISFDPSKLDIYRPEKQIMAETVVKMLIKIMDISNSNLIRNANGLLSKKLPDVNLEWVSHMKKRVPDNKYKMSY